MIAPLRVAGRSAAGLRMTPADPASTVGQVDVWADPSSGLPLMVEIFSRGSASPALKSQFFQVSPWRGGLSTFVVIAVRGSAGRNLVKDTLSAGGAALAVTGGTGALISAPLINAVLVRPPGFFVTFLLAGTVSAQVLEQAAATLPRQVPPT